jgi:ATP-binding cassette subfamily B protein
LRIAFRILGYLKPYRFKMVLMYASMAVALALQLIIPAEIGRAIDHGIEKRDLDYVLRAALIIVALAAFQGIFTFGRTYISTVIAERIGYDVRNDIYQHLQRMPFSFYDRAQTGQLMSRATEDINNIRAMILMTIRPLVLAVSTFIAVTFLLFREDWVLAAVSLSMMPILIFWSVRWGVVIRPLFLGVQQQFGVMTTVLQENVAGSRLVRAFAQEQVENRRFESELESLFNRNMDAAKSWAYTYPMMLFISGVGVGVTLWLGGYRVISGAMSIGTLVAFGRYLQIIAEPIGWLGNVINRISRAIASGERIFEITDAKPKIRDKAGAVDLPAMTGDVVFEDVVFSYAGARKKALDSVSFHARAGETIGLLGPTGSGKSTIISLLPRFYDPTGGKVLIDGQDLRDLTLKSVRSQIGSVMQESFLFSVTIKENIAFGRPDATMDEIIAAAKAAKAHDFILNTANGYDTVIGERGVSLSGGQKQRLAIARALLLDPRILILDDATSSVDSETEHEIQEALRNLMKGRTTFIIAQRLSSVRDASQILILDEGKIVARGSHASLLNDSDFYRELYDQQVANREALRG